MRIVSPFLNKVFYPALAMAGVFHRASAAGLAVVTYHGVLPQGYEPIDAALDGNLIGAEMLRRQLRLLKAHYNVISPDDVLAWREERGALPPRAVLLTCDDGLLNCLTDMLPVLQQEEVTCLFFVTGASVAESRSTLWYEELFLLFLLAPAGPFEISSVGLTIRGELRSSEPRSRKERRALWWNSVKRLSQVDEGARASFLAAARMQFGGQRDSRQDKPAWWRRFGLLTRGELRELAASGMTVGAHTLSHPMLSLLPAEEAYAEISESRIRLEGALPHRLWAFAYPFGNRESVTPEVLAMPQKAGYEAAFVNFGGGLGVDLPPYALPRVHVTAEMNLAELEAHVSGFHVRMQQRAGRPTRTLGALCKNSPSK
ncbi:MAG TPA: polysaccharide deacetylase family protein [Candidatus Sulfotelmatobacter sp.]|jgi:peptidoglycan/xylan/chitin deacetylase (PgdA/CDA1 family)